MGWDIDVREKVISALPMRFSFVFCMASMRWEQNCPHT